MLLNESSFRCLIRLLLFGSFFKRNFLEKQRKLHLDTTALSLADLSFMEPTTTGA